MFNAIYQKEPTNKVMVVFMLLFIASQSMALSRTCTMVTTGHDMAVSQSMTTKDPHAGHNMSSKGESKTTGSTTHVEMSDCCTFDCQCAQNTCSSSNLMFSNVIHASFVNNLNTSFFDDSDFIYSLTSSALFRPPIIC